MTAYVWHGVDGSTWDLNDGEAVLGAGVTGLVDPSTEFYGLASPILDGFRLTGTRVKERRVFWPVQIAALGADWLALRRRFMASFSYTKPGSWEVINDDGTVRNIPLRLVGQADSGYALDPSIAGFEIIGLELMADDPWWLGPVESRRFTALDGTADALFDPAGTVGRDFFLGSGFTVQGAFVANPGDVPAWPKWTVTGPLDSFSVGVDGQTISATFDVPGGEFLVIDTSPSAQLARWSNGDLIPLSQFVEFGFGQVAAGDEVPLEVAMQGTGTIEVEVAPRFYRAF